MKLEIDVAEFAAQLKAGKGIGRKDGTPNRNRDSLRECNKFCVNT